MFYVENETPWFERAAAFFSASRGVEKTVYRLKAKG